MKICIVLDHPRQHHYYIDDQGNMTNVYLNTYHGKLLKDVMENDYLLGLDEHEWMFTYAYDKIPDAVTNNKGQIKKYKPPKDGEAKERFPYLTEDLMEHKPDVIVPTGNIGCKYFFNRKAITKLRGIPEQVDIKDEDDSYTAWVLPTFSMEYVDVDRNKESLMEADYLTLSKYMEVGESAFVPEENEYTFHRSIDTIKNLFEYDIPNADTVAWDLETNTLHPEVDGAKPLVMTVSCFEGDGHTIPLEHKEFQWEGMELDMIYSYIQNFVADRKIRKVGHNIAFDMKFLKLTKGFNVFENHWDTKILYFTIVNQAVEASFQLSDLSYEMTTIGGYDRGLEEAKARILEGNPGVNEVDGSDFNYEWFDLIETLHPYAAGDTDACIRIFNRLYEKSEKINVPHIWKLNGDFYTYMVDATSDIEANGIYLDVEYNKRMSDAYDEEGKRLLEEIRKQPLVRELEDYHRELYNIGVEQMAIPKKDRDLEKAKLRDKYKNKLEFNPGSTKDKQKVLFTIPGIRLPANKDTLTDGAQERKVNDSNVEPGDYKTNMNVLKMIKKANPEMEELCTLMIEYAEISQKISNFTHKLRRDVDKYSLVHPGYNITGTVTSRLSSSGSFNAQNLPSEVTDPRRFDYKYPIKRMFRSRFKNGFLVQADYSALEMRLLALISGDISMIRAFLDGKDIHKDTATLMENVGYDDVTKKQRKAAKGIGFSIVYGKSEFSFAEENAISKDEAKEKFDRFYETKPAVKELVTRVHDQVKKDGYVETLAGYRRYLNNINSSDDGARSKALRESVNTIIQGTGAYLTNLAVIKINQFLKKKKLRSLLVMTVHDSIVVDSPPEEVTQVAKLLKYIMENLSVEWLYTDLDGENIRFPIEADVEIGVNYNDAVGYDAEDYVSFVDGESYCRYWNDMKHLENLKENDMISEEKHGKLEAMLESRKPKYQKGELPHAG